MYKYLKYLGFICITILFSACNNVGDSSPTTNKSNLQSNQSTTATFATWEYVGQAGASKESANEVQLEFDPKTHAPYISFISEKSKTAKVMKIGKEKWEDVFDNKINTTSHKLVFNSSGEASICYTSPDKGGINFIKISSTNNQYNNEKATPIVNGVSGWNYDCDSDGKNILYFIASRSLAFVDKFSMNGDYIESIGERNFAGNSVWAEKIIQNPVTHELYISFIDNDKLSVMKYNGKNWIYVGNKEFTYSKADKGSQIAFNPQDGKPYVAYRSNKKLNVMRFTGSSWIAVGQTDFASTSFGSFDDVSLTFSSEKSPYIAEPYVSFIADNGKARVMKYTDATGWQQIGNDASFMQARSTSLKFSPSTHKLYLAYQNVGAIGNSASVVQLVENELPPSHIELSPTNVTITKNLQTVKIIAKLTNVINTTDQAVGLEIPDSAKNSFYPVEPCILNAENQQCELSITSTENPTSGVYTIKVTNVGGSLLDTKDITVTAKLPEWESVGNIIELENRIDSASIALSPFSNQPYITYIFRNGEHDDISVMKLQNNRWEYVGNRYISNTDNDASIIAFSPLSTEPFIGGLAYDVNYDMEPFVKMYNNSNWVSVGNQSFDKADYLNNVSLMFAPDNSLYMSFINWANDGEAKLFKFNVTANKWNLIPNLDNNQTASAISMAFDLKSSTPTVALYTYDRGNLVLKYENGSWIQLGTLPDEYIPNGFMLRYNPVNNQPYLLIAHNYTISLLTYDGVRWSYVGDKDFIKDRYPRQKERQHLIFSHNGVPYVLYESTNRRLNVISYQNNHWQHICNSSIKGTLSGDALAIDDKYLYLVYKADQSYGVSVLRCQIN